VSTSRKAQRAQSSAETSADAGALIEGLIIDGSRGLYQVETEVGVYACTIRGRLRKELTYADSQNLRRGVRDVTVRPHDPVAVGDRVRVLPTGGGTGVIEGIVARGGGTFTRRDPDAGGRKLTSVAGLEQLVLVFAVCDPEPHLGLLDRLLAVAEVQGLAVCICLTKLDLGTSAHLERRLNVYRALGYSVIGTSVATGEGTAELRDLLAGHVSALIGKSGVGKSSLLNAIEPGLAQRVSAVSASTGKGRHTTTGTRLCRLSGPAGGYIADTAGIRALGLTEEVSRRLDWCFREFRPFLGKCRDRRCTHVHEPYCAIQDAVAAGTLDAVRYASYRRLREEDA
jgi:ribosome biogenesis GTPase